MNRSEILQTAEKCVNGDRQGDYGSPERSFQTISHLWSDYLYATNAGRDVVIEPKDVAAMLVLLKIARIAGGRFKADNWVDLAGYAACGGEIESIESKEGNKK